MNKFTASIALLGSLASLSLLYVGVAEARTCQERYNQCMGRCLGRDDSSSCALRTCIPQSNACTGGEAGPGKSGGKGTGGSKGTGSRGPSQIIVRDHRKR